MLQRPIYCAGSTPAVRYAAETLAQRGVPIAHAPGEETGCLLLDVPSFDSAGALRGGGRLEDLLRELSCRHSVELETVFQSTLELCRELNGVLCP